MWCGLRLASLPVAQLRLFRCCPFPQKGAVQHAHSHRRTHTLPFTAAADMLPPSSSTAIERQSGHVCKMLRDIVRSGTNLDLADVSVDITAPLPQVEDMRRLCSWWLSVGFHITQQVASMCRDGAAASKVHCRVAGTHERELELVVQVERSAGEDRMVAEEEKEEARVWVAASTDDLLYVREERCEEAGAGRGVVAGVCAEDDDDYGR